MVGQLPEGEEMSIRILQCKSRSRVVQKRTDLQMIRDWELEKLSGWSVLFYTKKFLVQVAVPD